ncbi:MAG: hypothetical protein OXN88_00015 [Chloroflexota bacterium]|nr:hypothetical protein [Chloroflexota bacterium]
MPLKSLFSLFGGRPKMSQQEIASLCELFLRTEAEAIERLKFGQIDVAVLQAISANDLLKKYRELGLSDPPSQVPHPGPQPYMQGRPGDWQWACDKELHHFAELIRANYDIQSHYEGVAKMYVYNVQRMQEARQAELDWQMQLTRWSASLPELPAKQYTLIEIATFLGLEKPNRHTIERRALADLLLETGWETVQRGKRVLYQHPDFSPS